MCVCAPASSCTCVFPQHTHRGARKVNLLLCTCTADHETVVVVLNTGRAKCDVMNETVTFIWGSNHEGYCMLFRSADDIQSKKSPSID